MKMRYAQQNPVEREREEGGRLEGREEVGGVTTDRLEI